jgi:hypothetical protein
VPVRPPSQGRRVSAWMSCFRDLLACHVTIIPFAIPDRTPPLVQRRADTVALGNHFGNSNCRI